MSNTDLPTPDYSTPNMRLIGYTDMGGRSDGVQVMVNKGHAIVGHMFSKGFSVIDVRDPRSPKPVAYVAGRRTPGHCIFRPMTTCCSS